MKMLTICQPYADLIITGEKLVENRTWSTPHRGWFVVHAGKSKAWFRSVATQYDEFFEMGRGSFPLRDRADYVYGAAIGIARLIDVVPVARIEKWCGGGDPFCEDSMQRYLRWANGPQCWVLSDAIAFGRPIPCRGQMGLFDAPPDVVDKVASMIGAEAAS